MTTQCVQVKLEIGHKATIRAKPTAEGFTHDWTVFVRGPEGCNVQHFVERVVFQLHESFPKPKRVVKEPPYQVSESGYAGFILPIEVVFKNKEEPKKVIYKYDLYLQFDGPPINPARVEKLTFNNPTEDFRRKLIRGGGVGVLASEGGTILNQLQHVPSKPSPAHSNFSSAERAHKKQISEAIKAPKSSSSSQTAAAVAPTDSVAPQPALSSSSPSSVSSSAASSPSSPPPPSIPPSIPLPTSSIAKEVVQRSVAASHLHVPDSFVDLFGQPIKTSRGRSPDPSKFAKEASRPPKSASTSSTSSSFKLSKSSASHSSSKEPVTSSNSKLTTVRSGSSTGSSSKEPKSSKASSSSSTVSASVQASASLPPQESATATSSLISQATKTSKNRTSTKDKSISSLKRPKSPPPLTRPPSSSSLDYLDKKRKRLETGTNSSKSSQSAAVSSRPKSSASTSSSSSKTKESSRSGENNKKSKVENDKSFDKPIKRTIDVTADKDNDTQNNDIRDVKQAKKDKKTSSSEIVDKRSDSTSRGASTHSSKSTSKKIKSLEQSSQSGAINNNNHHQLKAAPRTPPNEPPSPAVQPPSEVGPDVGDASPSSSISFSSLQGGHAGGRGGSGPLGALMAELVDEDDFLSPLSSDAGSPLHPDSDVEADVRPSSSPPMPRQAEKRPPSPPSHSPQTQSRDPPAINVERQKLKEKKKKVLLNNDPKAMTKKTLSTSAVRKKSTTSKSKSTDGGGNVMNDGQVISLSYNNNNTSTPISVGSTTDEHDIIITDDYIVELKELQERIIAIKDRGHLQRIVNVIEETGLYQVTSTTFDFDLCMLDRITVKKLQTCLTQATSRDT